MPEKGKAIYSTIDEGLETLISERAEKQGCSKASVISDLLQKGLETEEALKMTEKVKEDFTDHNRLKSEVSDLKQSSNGFNQKLVGVSNNLVSVKEGLSGLETKNEELSELVRELDQKYEDSSKASVTVARVFAEKVGKEISGSLKEYVADAMHEVYSTIGYPHCPKCDKALHSEKEGTLVADVLHLKKNEEVAKRKAEAEAKVKAEEIPKNETWAERRLREREEKKEREVKK